MIWTSGPVFRKDHAQTEKYSGMTIRRTVILLQAAPNPLKT
jgi:hypothetical protein